MTDLRLIPLFNFTKTNKLSQREVKQLVQGHNSFYSYITHAYYITPIFRYINGSLKFTE